MKALLLCLVLLTSCATPSRPTQAPSVYTVKYAVAGSITKAASLTYTNESNGTEQIDAAGLPWSKTFTVKPGAFLYLSAQNKQDEGAVTAYIIVNGQTRKTSTSTGAYVIASVDYRCCD